MAVNKTNEMLLNPDDLPVNADRDIRSELSLKIIDEVYSTEDIEVKTELNPAQIVALTKGKLYAQRYGCTLMADLCETLMIRQVSKGRAGRKEFTDIAKAVQSPQEELPPTLKSRLLGER